MFKGNGFTCIALIGFATLATVLARQPDEEARRLNFVRLRSMLELAVRLTVFCLFPLPWLEGDGSPTLWRVASALAMTFSVSSIYFTARQSLDVQTAFRSPWINGTMIVSSTIANLCFLANVLGIAGGPSFELYLAAIVFASIVVIPAMLLCGVIYVTSSIHLGRLLPGARTCLRGTIALAPWNMAEIFLIGILVSFIKIVSLADIELGLSFWAYALFTLGVVFVTLFFDRRTLWSRLDALARDESSHA